MESKDLILFCLMARKFAESVKESSIPRFSSLFDFQLKFICFNNFQFQNAYFFNGSKWIMLYFREIHAMNIVSDLFSILYSFEEY